MAYIWYGRGCICNVEFINYASCGYYILFVRFVGFYAKEKIHTHTHTQTLLKMNMTIPVHCSHTHTQNRARARTSVRSHMTFNAYSVQHLPKNFYTKDKTRM